MGRDPAMALVTSSGFHRVRSTVTDIGRSKAFYDEVFGWLIAVGASDSVGVPGVVDSPEQFYGAPSTRPRRAASSICGPSARRAELVASDQQAVAVASASHTCRMRLSDRVVIRVVSSD